MFPFQVSSQHNSFISLSYISSDPHTKKVVDPCFSTGIPPFGHILYIYLTGRQFTLLPQMKICLDRPCHQSETEGLNLISVLSKYFLLVYVKNYYFYKQDH